MAALDTAFYIIPFIHWGMIVSLFIVSGIAWSFNLWVVPIIKLNPSKSAIAQLLETSRRGGAWLEPLNASFAFLFGITAALLSQHSDTSVASQWKPFAASFATLLQVAWWERVMIFPLEESIANLGKGKEKSGGAEGAWMDHETSKVLHKSLDEWSRWHAVRATLPLIGSLIAFVTKLQNGD
ncbi:hypothetical protein GGP41_004975 [Bipolaris sorokiniana]|uniref:Uncharacterized protein n=2 Tax=Cochliobolus sativus TaxID=45130 RepID=A0A8H6DWX3_COCSA|nr:uncharacterized protein COCSADRAFT_37809 [Bipolaris sorokiniana ND90Pr]EMD62928.1 hypothetical protein COCSADRAFT_37809 [Bipolaris sorokiniana ND90Pr]KAF5849525.1 hypothetical protein GGP41_004975 [Bipolaris sorokiniana]